MLRKAGKAGATSKVLQRYIEMKPTQEAFDQAIAEAYINELQHQLAIANETIAKLRLRGGYSAQDMQLHAEEARREGRGEVWEGLLTSGAIRGK